MATVIINLNEVVTFPPKLQQGSCAQYADQCLTVNTFNMILISEAISGD